MFLVLSGSCLCQIHWRQVWSQEWRCSRSSADRRCSNYIWVIKNLLHNNVPLIIEVWQYVLKVWILWRYIIWINSLKPSDIIRHQWIGSSLVQGMACCLFGTKPLPELMPHNLKQCWLTDNQTFRNKFSWNMNQNTFSFKKIKLNIFSIKNFVNASMYQGWISVTLVHLISEVWW